MPRLHSRTNETACPGRSMPAFPHHALVGRLQLDKHGAGIAPVRNRIGVRILRCRKARPVGLVHRREDVIRHQRNGWHFLHRELDVALAELDRFWIVEPDRAGFLDDLVQRRARPTLPVALRLRFAGLGDKLRMPAVHEIGQILMASPGFDAPANEGVEIAGSPPCATSTLASIPACFHCCTIMVPARVITGRKSPSTITRTVNGFPSGVNHAAPRLLKPAFSSSSCAACGSVFHQPIPKARAISFGSAGICSPMEGRSMSAICLPTVGSYGLTLRLPVSISKPLSHSSIG